jgi:hypothetical protein
VRVFSASQLPSSSCPFPYEHHLFVAARCVPDVISRLVLYHSSSGSPKRVWPGVVVNRRRNPKCAKTNLRHPESHGPRFLASSGLTSRLRCGMAQQPRHGRDHGQACPVQSSFDGLLHPRRLAAQGYARGERIPRERLHQHPGCQMSFWTGRASQPACQRCPIAIRHGPPCRRADCHRLDLEG